MSQMSMMRLVAGGQAGAAPFNPLSINWVHAFWAEDSSWANPGNGNAVSSWRNAGTEGTAVTQATGTRQPLYRSSYTNLNSKPAVDFDGVDDGLYGATASTSQPNHVVVVGWLDSSTGANPSLIDGNAGRHLLRQQGPTNGVLMYAGGVTSFSGGVWGAFIITALFNGASSQCVVNGSTLTPGDVGTQTLQGLSIGASDVASANFHKGAITFVGVKASALTTTEATNLRSWAISYYGTP